MKMSNSSWKQVLIMNLRSLVKNMKLPDLPVDSPALNAFSKFVSGSRDSLIVNEEIPSLYLNL